MLCTISSPCSSQRDKKLCREYDSHSITMTLKMNRTAIAVVDWQLFGNIVAGTSSLDPWPGLSDDMLLTY